MMDDWPYIEKEAAKLYDRFGPHSLVHFLASINRALEDPEAPLRVEDLQWAVNQAIEKAADRARYVEDRERGPAGLSGFYQDRRSDAPLDAATLSLVTATLRRHHPSFDPALFDRWRMTRRDEDTVFYFGSSIRYVPPWGSHRYEIGLFAPTVCLEEALATGADDIEGCVVTAGALLSNPDEHDHLRCDVGDTEFLVPWDASRAAVELVLDAVRKSSEIGDIKGGVLPDGTTMTIRDRGDRYDVEVVSRFTESFFSVVKSSGEIMDARHNHLEPDPEEEPDAAPGTAGSMAPAFNAGLALGIILFFAALYPLVGDLTRGWRWAASGVGFVLFWVLAVNLMLGPRPAWVTGLLAAAVAGGWAARWLGAEAWLPPVVVLGGAALGVGVGLLGGRSEQARERTGSSPASDG
ncbi:MAG: hypothetical protein Q8N53_15520 [Longimicrobiales bacterium]|nr:hypothetical protein [Longimicrobiales bacterium]